MSETKYNIAKKRLLDKCAELKAAIREDAYTLLFPSFATTATPCWIKVDTNHLERALCPIPMCRKNWLFCWTETGADRGGIIQNLLSTYRLQGVDPYHYLVDALQRISLHPARNVANLPPALERTVC